MKRLKAASELAVSMAEISRLYTAETKAKKQQEESALRKLAPDAVTKLRKNDLDFNKLTVREMRAIACIYYNEQLPNTRKATVVEKMKNLYNAQPQRLPASKK